MTCLKAQPRQPMSALTFVLGTGAVVNYLMAQRPRTAQEELTLANLEAMASIIKDYENLEDGKIGWCVGDYKTCDEPFPGLIIPGGFVSK